MVFVSNRDTKESEGERKELLPVSMDPRSTKGKTKVNEGRVDESSLLGKIEEIVKVAKVSETTPDTISCTVFIQEENLTWTEPSLFNV